MNSWKNEVFDKLANLLADSSSSPQCYSPFARRQPQVMRVSLSLLLLGGGGSFALTLDEDLLNGSSGPCETFRNSCLAHIKEFEPKNVELMGFHSFITASCILSYLLFILLLGIIRHVLLRY